MINSECECPLHYIKLQLVRGLVVCIIDHCCIQLNPPILQYCLPPNTAAYFLNIVFLG